MVQKRDIIIITVFLIIVLFVWAGLSSMPTAENYIQVVNNNHDWDSWAERFYSPDDFENGTVSEPRVLHLADYQHYQFFTHRIILDVMSGVTHGINIRSADYSMRLFVDGQQAALVGVPGTTRAETIPRTNNIVHYFIPQTEQIEVIVQTANFVHNTGGRPPSFYIGYVQDIERHRLSQTFMQFLIIGSLLTSALYHLALFIMNRKRKAEFVFAVCCLLLLMMTSDPVPMFFPEYNWEFMFRLEYIIFYSSFGMVPVLFAVLMPHLVPWRIFKLYLSICGILMLSAVFLDTTVFSRFIQFFYPIGVSMILYGLVLIGINMKSGKAQDFLAFIGLLVITLFTVNDIVDHINIFGLAETHGFIPSLGVQFTAPVGMVFFVFCYALLLALKYANTERLAMEASTRAKAVTAENAALDSMSRMKSVYLANMSHEMKTPLTVISVHVQQAAERYEAGGGDNPIITGSLHRAHDEIMHLARMTENSLWLASMQESHAHMDMLSIVELLTKSAEAYRTVIEKKGNSLYINVPVNLPEAIGNADQLIQVMANLLTNANTHTENGIIKVEALADDGYITVIVKDNGAGVKPEILPVIFERGITGSDSVGIGLSICKSIIETHGGLIKIANAKTQGTVVTFTIPIFAGERGDGNV